MHELENAITDFAKTLDVQAQKQEKAHALSTVSPQAADDSDILLAGGGSEVPAGSFATVASNPSVGLGSTAADPGSVVSLQAAPTPPSGLPVDPRAAYFVPRRSGPFWDAIRDAGAMALFTPSEFADAEFELLAPTPG